MNIYFKKEYLYIYKLCILGVTTKTNKFHLKSPYKNSFGGLYMLEFVDIKTNAFLTFCESTFRIENFCYLNNTTDYYKYYIQNYSYSSGLCSYPGYKFKSIIYEREKPFERDSILEDIEVSYNIWKLMINL